MNEITTPFGHKLATELENEFRRIDKEWFFQWHGLSYGKEINVDGFGSRPIRAGGIRFESGTSIEIVYWEAVARYLKNKIDEVFGRTETEIKAAQLHVTELAEDAAFALSRFSARILQHAILTDRLLKGRGYPDHSYTAHNSSKVSYSAEIERRKNSLIKFYTAANVPGRGQRFEKIIEMHKGKLVVLGAIAAAITIMRALGLL